MLVCRRGYLPTYLLINKSLHITFSEHAYIAHPILYPLLVLAMLERDEERPTLSSSRRAYTSTAASCTPTLNSGLFCQHCVEQSPCLYVVERCTTIMSLCYAHKLITLHPGVRKPMKKLQIHVIQPPTATHRSPIDLIIFLRQLATIMCTTLQIGSLSLMVTYSIIIIMAR